MAIKHMLDANWHRPDALWEAVGTLAKIIGNVAGCGNSVEKYRCGGRLQVQLLGAGCWMVNTCRWLGVGWGTSSRKKRESRGPDGAVLEGVLCMLDRSYVCGA